MGEATLIPHSDELIIRSVFFFYGNAASEALSLQVARDIEQHWNEAAAVVEIKKRHYRLRFKIDGRYAGKLTEMDVYENTDPKNNYFRVENISPLEVSFVDGLGCNTGFFLLQNLLQDSTTAAHEYGHTLGLPHPRQLDIRGKGTPGIMYPRGTVVDAVYQYNPHALAGDNTNGGTINPLSRKVLQQDIDDLQLYKLRFDKDGTAVVGAFSSVWHDAVQ